MLLARTLRAVISDPAGVALAGAIDGVAGAVVGAKADLSTSLPIAATGAHCHTTHTHTHNRALDKVSRDTHTNYTHDTHTIIISREAVDVYKVSTTHIQRVE